MALPLPPGGIVDPRYPSIQCAQHSRRRSPVGSLKSFYVKQPSLWATADEVEYARDKAHSNPSPTKELHTPGTGHKKIKIRHLPHFRDKLNPPPFTALLLDQLIQGKSPQHPDASVIQTFTPKARTPNYTKHASSRKISHRWYGKK